MAVRRKKKIADESQMTKRERGREKEEGRGSLERRRGCVIK